MNNWKLISNNEFPELIHNDNTTSDYVIGCIKYMDKLYVDRVSMYGSYFGKKNYFVDAEGEHVEVVKWMEMPKI